MKNKQIVVQLHEGCIDPNDPVLIRIDDPAAQMRWLIEALQQERVIIDLVQVVDCDCDVE